MKHHVVHKCSRALSWAGFHFAVILAALVMSVAFISCSSTQAAPTPIPPKVGESESNGAQLWKEKTCLACHGVEAEGGTGPRLAETKLSLEQFKEQVRNPREEMPIFLESVVSHLELETIYEWLMSLK